MPFAAGQRLGTYEIEHALQGDAPGECYRARQTSSTGSAFVRVLARSWSLEPSHVRAFEPQAETLRQLAPPNLARLYDVSVQDGFLYAASEWLEGETLRQKFSKGKLLPHKAAGYAIQIASGLAAGHLTGLMHGDLKPESIMIDQDARLKIRDFELANLGYSYSESLDTDTGRGGSAFGRFCARTGRRAVRWRQRRLTIQSLGCRKMGTGSFGSRIGMAISKSMHHRSTTPVRAR